MGLVYDAVALLCLAAFKSKKKSPDLQGGLRSYASAVRTFLLAVKTRRTQLPELARAAAPWFVLALFLLTFGVIRQFNLQVLVTELFQKEAHAGGWYEGRRENQLRFIGMTAIVGTVVLFAVLLLLRKRLADVGLAFVAAILLATLLVVRATSHHDIDTILMSPVLGLAPAYWIEMLALLLIAASAVLSLRRARSRAGAVGRPIVARIDSIDPT